VRALYIHKKEASYKDLAGPTGLYPAIASQALSASRDLGLTKSAGKKGSYLLTPRGVEYARYLTENRTEECKVLLKRIIIENPIWTGVISYLKTSEGTQRNPIDLVMSTVEAKLGKQWSTDMRKQVSDSIVSILEYAGIVKRESGKIQSLVGPTSDPSSATVIASAFKPTSIPDLGAAPSKEVPGFYEIAGDGFYIKIRKDPTVIAEAYDHLHLIMKRNNQQLSSMPAEPSKEVHGSSN